MEDCLSHTIEAAKFQFVERERRTSVHLLVYCATWYDNLEKTGGWDGLCKLRPLPQAVRRKPAGGGAGILRRSGSGNGG
jgi:hypothetical protein